MKTLWLTWARFQVWREERRLKRSRGLFLKLLNDKASGMDKIVAQAAVKHAKGMVMNWLDGKRIQHCRFCPETAPLRKHGIDQLCEGHWQMVRTDQKTATPT